MRPIRKPRTAEDRRKRRHFRVRKTIRGRRSGRGWSCSARSSTSTPSWSTTRGARSCWAMADRSEGVAPKADSGKVGKGFAVGMALAEKAKAQGITRVVFDRAGYAYHGRVKAVADGARKGGLEF